MDTDNGNDNETALTMEWAEKLRVSAAQAAVLPPSRQFCCLPHAALPPKCADALKS